MGEYGDDAPLRYAGFWRRAAAMLLDFLFTLPFALLYYVWSKYSRHAHLYAFLPDMIFNVWFHVGLVVRFGGTPGKLLMKVRIAQTDGSPFTLKAAILRYAMLFVVSLPVSIGSMLAESELSDAQYFQLDWLERATEIQRLVPSWYGVASALQSIWLWSELLTMLFNKKRRSLHDLIAGTVVLRTDGVRERPIS